MRSSDEPRETRARLIEAADDERRALERALHDGVQQDLIAVSVRLQLARQLAATDPPAALELLDEIGSDVQRGARARARPRRTRSIRRCSTRTGPPRRAPRRPQPQRASARRSRRTGSVATPSEVEAGRVLRLPRRSRGGRRRRRAGPSRSGSNGGGTRSGVEVDMRRRHDADDRRRSARACRAIASRRSGASSRSNRQRASRSARRDGTSCAQPASAR